ncbi:MAG: PAS domain S-box protein [Chloroflexi bacterium]|nr:PAS domain S-box protein [Chloroflexota bacterium]
MATSLPAWLRYTCAVATTVVAILCSLALQPLVSRTPSAFFFLAITLSAWVGGLGPGLLSAALGLLALDYFFIQPLYAFRWNDPSDLLTLVVLGAVAFIMSSTSASMRRASLRARKSEASERLQREWLSTTLSSIGDAVIATDAQGAVRFMNGVAEALTGWPRTEAAGQALDQIFVILNEQTRQPVESPVASVLRERTVVGLGNHAVLVARDGTERPIDDSGAPIRGEDGAVIGVVLVFRDVSQRRRAEDALRESEDRLRRIFDSSPIGIVSWELDGRVTDSNDAFLRMIGYSRQELAEGHLNRVALTAEEYRAADEKVVQELLATGASRSYEKEYVRKNGTRVPVLVGTVLFDGPRRHGVSFLLDISQRRALDRMQREFIANVTHELRNPLTSIKGYAQIMERWGTYNAQPLRAIVSQANQLERLVDDLLDASSLEAGRLDLRPVQTDLIGVVRTCADEVRATRDDRAVRVEAPPGPVEGWWDADRVSQILRNLLSNALTYSPDGGQVTVRVVEREREAEVSVEDHGVGISEDALPRLFSRFYRADATARSIPGLGLGLYISRQLVEAHGGAMRVQSVVGRGTTVSFTLPYDPPAS